MPPKARAALVAACVLWAVSFVTTKNANISEVQRFLVLHGKVDDKGKGYHDDFMNVPLDVDGDGAAPPERSRRVLASKRVVY